MHEIQVDISGGDRTGKSTVLHIISQALRDKGFRVEILTGDSFQQMPDRELAVRVRLLRETTHIMLKEHHVVDLR